MAARNRPRTGIAKDDSADAHEERNMWNQIVTDVKKLKQINTSAAEVSARIVELEEAMTRIDPETGKSRLYLLTLEVSFSIMCRNPSRTLRCTFRAALEYPYQGDR